MASLSAPKTKGRFSVVRRRFSLWLGSLPVAPVVRAQPTAERVRESLVKAALLHKFPSFVEWPPGTFARPDSPLRIGVLGDDQVLRDLVELARDIRRDGRPVVATRVTPGDPLNRYEVLYLKMESSTRLLELLQQVPEGVLTVSDVERAPARASVLHFFIEDANVKFGASVEAAARQKLRLSSRLLSVAK